MHMFDVLINFTTLYHKLIWVQVPGGPHKKELLENLDRVPTYVQQLQFTVKNPTVGKAATFIKVDNVIQETKNLMNVISKVVTTCFVCATKVSSAKLVGAPHCTKMLISMVDVDYNERSM